MSIGWSQSDIINVFDVGFFDTDSYRNNGAGAVSGLATFFSTNRNVTNAIGYSLGATILRDYIWAKSIGLFPRAPLPRAALLSSGISDQAAEWASRAKQAPIGSNLSLPFGWNGDTLRQKDAPVRLLIRKGDVPFERLIGKTGIGVDLAVDGVKTAPNTCVDGGHCSQPAASRIDMAALLYLASLR